MSKEPGALHLLRILIHLGFGGLIVYGVRLLGGSNLNIAVSLLLYFAATVTRDTISYWVMFSPSDILALGALVVMLAGVTKGWSPSKLGLSTLVVSALAIYSKENGIAASGGVLLLTLIFWRRLTMRHRLWIVLTQALLMLTYIPAYRSFTAGKWMTLSEFSPESAQVQGMFVLKGIVISLSGPFSAIYLNLRGEALSQLAAITITIVVAIVFAWFLWIAYERDRNQLFVALCSRFWLGVVVALLVIGFLLPYVPGRWFGSRMLVGTVALGAALWGLIIGDALQAWANRLDGSNWGQFNRGLGFVVILAALGAGTPIDAHIRGEMATTAALRAVVQEAQAKGFTDICLVGFGTKGSFLRKRNARGVIGYESKRQVAAHSFETRAEIPDALQCVVVTYDEAVIKLGPLVVEWSDRSDLHSSSIP